jgi:hypothetical protein
MLSGIPASPVGHDPVPSGYNWTNEKPGAMAGLIGED